ncbi:OmpA family protein [Marinifilum sp.]|uniref:OmpA family protein n=1 Tax=Marinifilum sp. TaxID=2033137 RepID=UPI003BAD0ABC
MTAKIQLSILLVFFAFVLQAQNRFLRRGEKAFNKRHYSEAIANFKHIKGKNPEIDRKIAQSYFFLGSYKEAESYYQKINDSEKSAGDLLSLSHIYLNYGNRKASILFSEQAAKAGMDKSVIESRIKSIRNLNQVRTKSNMRLRPISEQPLSKSLGLAVLSDKIVFSNFGNINTKGEKTYQLFSSEFIDQEFTKAKEFAAELDKSVDIGSISFSADGSLMYYTRWYTKRGRQFMEIVEARMKNAQWKASSILPFNSRKYSCAHPFISKDGKEIYFASDMPGGFGGMDLYVSHKIGNSWGMPINLGEDVNTSLNEIYPCILKDGKLWFASNGHVGYGRQDLFYAEKTQEGKWGNIANAGSEFNSSFNDFSIQDSPAKGQLLFVSDRKEKGYVDRIYSLGADRLVKVELVVRDKHNQNPISTPSITVKRVINDQQIPLEQNASGTYEFDVSYYELGRGILYEIEAEKEGYEALEMKYYPMESNLNVEILLMRLEKGLEDAFAQELKPIHYPDKRLIFRTIHFDSGIPYLNSKAKQQLKKFADFWKIYPDLDIVINAHSDSRGSDESNMILSIKRAKKAVEYLLAQGVEHSKIVYNAYGEQFVINGCVDGVDCSEEQHRENRRLELLFVIK